MYFLDTDLGDARNICVSNKTSIYECDQKLRYDQFIIFFFHVVFVIILQISAGQLHFQVILHRVIESRLININKSLFYF